MRLTHKMTYEDIKRKAYTIWQWRQRNNMSGTPEGDWHKAIDELRLMESQINLKFYYPPSEIKEVSDEDAIT